MFRRFSINFAIFSMFVDILLVLISMVLAVNMGGSRFPIPVFQGNFDHSLYFLFPLIWWLIYLIGSRYDGHRNFHLLDELASFVAHNLAAIVLSAGVLYLSIRDTARSLFVSFALLNVMLQLAWRLCVRLYWRLIHSQGTRRASQRVLIVGAGTVGRMVSTQIKKEWSETGVELVGFLDDDPARQGEPDVIGGSADILAVIAKHQVDEVIITLAAQDHGLRDELVNQASVLPVRVWVVPDVFRLALYRSSVEEFGGMPLVGIRAPTLTDYQRFVKRGFDLVISSIMFILSLPFMLIIAAAIKLDSDGPVIFRQKRIGENGQLFTMYKFRTMVQDAEALQRSVERKDERGNLIHKSRGDPRVTKVGRFLRSTSLDELPQLVNVLMGDMSIIGPRPELPALVDNYEPWQRVRLTVPPGLTGWWQVNGRSDRPMHLHTEDDIYYVKNYSLWLDIYILLKTVLVLARREGAF